MPKLKFKKEEWEVASGIRLRDAIEQVNLNAHSVLAVKDGVLVTDDVKLKDDDVIELISVVSGG